MLPFDSDTCMLCQRVLLGQVPDTALWAPVVGSQRITLHESVGGSASSLCVKVDPSFVESAVSASEDGVFAPGVSGGGVQLIQGVRLGSAGSDSGFLEGFKDVVLVVEGDGGGEEVDDVLVVSVTGGSGRVAVGGEGGDAGSVTVPLVGPELTVVSVER